ncbi:Histidine kinase-, DNA gyrase B-, and HSP90-like ATPase [Mariniphaga anaerophila]|uniref:histidine kinase n=1 Tax=Mariniphaga anaerophila TaxID=1484053 RepID=A0A1M5E827_9BACT|nr:sensor histidine kinase [Mariniphaga anaerophila]SHF75211.1 Histidine kinase-, DNA gyrase B-, and HSP90-like ATPase [Mariniphaga anaerophila]
MSRPNSDYHNCFTVPVSVNFFFAILLLVSSSVVLAQPKEKIDSLHNEVGKARTDSARCELLTRIAEEYRFLNSDSAVLYVNKARALAGQIKSVHLTVNIAIQNAIILYEKGEYESSIGQLREIDPLAEQLGDERYLLKLCQTYGNSFGLLNDHKQAIEYELKALDYAKSLKDSMAMANLYINIGSDFHYIKEYEKAIDYCNKARQVYRKLGQNFYQGFALNNMANYSNHLKEYLKALEYATEASAYWNEENNERLMAYLYHNYGKAYKGLVNYNEAEKFYLKSIAIRTKNGDIKDLIITNNELAGLYMEQNRLIPAFALVNENYRMATEKSFALEAQQSAALLAEMHEKKGELAQAVRFLKINQQLKDSLQTNEQAKEVLRLQTKYETAEKENLILQQRNKITENQLALKNRNFWIFGLSSLTILIGLTGFLLYKQQLLKNASQQKDNEMKLALEKIENQNRIQEERLSISRDLHDNIGAHLTFIISSIDTLKQFVANRDVQMIDRLGSMSSFAKDTIRELRDTIWAMNRQSIGITDLKTRIANFLNSANQIAGKTTLSFTSRMKNDNEVLFDSKTGMNIYRILQEAVNNALKHAEATHITVSFEQQDDLVRMCVEDNGKGFVTTDLYDGNGLQNMKNRASAIYGELEIVSRSNTGTCITCNFPIKT